MHNRYLETLQLEPGATKSDVKAAFRKLSKVYHPDINKDESAKEKFIAIHEAYKFLTDVGSKPNNEPVAYNYNPEKAAYEEWRRRAREYAWKKTKEAQRHQQLQIALILKYFNYVAAIIFAFNLVLSLDYFLPWKESKEPIRFTSKVYETGRYSKGKGVYAYDDIYLKNFQIRIDKMQIWKLQEANEVKAVSTSIFDTPLYIEAETENEKLKLYQAYSIYRVFGVLIPVMLLLGILYFYRKNNLDFRLSCAVVMLFLLSLQLILFFKF